MAPDPQPVAVANRRLPRDFGVWSDRLGMLVHRVRRGSALGGINNGNPAGAKLRRRQRWAHTKARAASKNIRGGKK